MSYGDDRVGFHPACITGLLLSFTSNTKISTREMASVADVIAADCRYEVWAYRVIKESDADEAIKWDVLTVSDECLSDVTAALEAHNSLSQEQFTLILDRVTSRMNERRLASC